MDSNQNPKKILDFSKESETDNTLSIDEFFRQLEAKEKDLDISSDLVIEVNESDSLLRDISDYLQMDLSVAPNKSEPAIAVFEETSHRPADNFDFQAEKQSLENQIAQMKIERGELFELARRRQTDFEAYKNRTERERGETFRNQISNLATQMLPVVDNLNRALDSSGNITEECTQDFKQFFEGIVLVSQQLNEILAEMGVQPILAVGERFDPHLHEAVATEITDEFPSQTITAEFLRGYRIGEKTVRASMVKVSVTSTGNLTHPTTVSNHNFS